MDLAKMNKMLEIFWWILGAISLIGVFIMTFVQGLDKWALWYVAPALCFVLALVRRGLAKKLEKSQSFRDGQKKK